MGVSWAFVVLLVYPALQLPMLWLVVRYFGLRNDDGPEDPRGYSFVEQDAPGGDSAPGHCQRCGWENDPEWAFCGRCLADIR